MRCPWYLFHRLFFEFGQGHRGPMIPYCPGPHELSVRPWCLSFQMVSLPLTGSMEHKA
ncbi:unnamed protein product [Staurois parvus]|uniref:Uncharacterized protein n=1 Tax=Staurois parvus TaxID=386267 RepID=A0ABN9CHE5_9NEOB|nr:unnamed protein product [Staurois parvus]